MVSATPLILQQNPSSRSETGFPSGTGVYGCSTSADISAVTAAHPLPDFKRQILAAFTNGFKDRPDTTFGTVNADVLEHFVPGFRRTDFVEVIKSNA